MPESDTGNNYGLCQFWQSLEEAVPESDTGNTVFVSSGSVWRKPCRKAILEIRSLSVLAVFGGSRAGKRYWKYGLCQFWQCLEEAVPESDTGNTVFVSSGSVWRKPCRKAILEIRSLSVLAVFGGSRAGKRYWKYGLCQFWQCLEEAVPESDARSVVFDIGRRDTQPHSNGGPNTSGLEPHTSALPQGTHWLRNCRGHWQPPC